MKKTDIKPKFFTNYIKGLEYSKEQDIFTFRDSSYKLINIDEKDESLICEFVNIKNEKDKKELIIEQCIIKYDNFNNTPFDSKIRTAMYYHSYYLKKLRDKRREERKKFQEVIEQRKLKRKEETRLRREERLRLKKEQREQERKNKKRKKLKTIYAYCFFCGKKFTKNSNIQKFCSKKCYKKFDNLRTLHKNTNSFIKEKVCPICKTHFMGSNVELYCSPACAKIAKERKKQL